MKGPQVLAREKLLDFIRQYPSLYFRIVPLNRRIDRTTLAAKDTDVVIEGYPRSANTYAVAAFELAQEKATKIARHAHTIAQIKRAVELGKPTLVIIRDPQDAAISYVIRVPNVTIKLALQRYIAFYSYISTVETKVTICEFSEVISDYAMVIARLNKRFNTSFQLPGNSREDREAIIQRVEQMEMDDAGGILSELKVGRPSPERKNKKQQLLVELRNDFVNQRLLQSCYSIYRETLRNL